MEIKGKKIGKEDGGGRRSSAFQTREASALLKKSNLKAICGRVERRKKIVVVDLKLCSSSFFQWIKRWKYERDAMVRKIVGTEK